ncbi:MAG: hypothetical protein QW303_01780 [Nitrososphaerota archaeon]|uniref:hypothetical protein n=1 Tax=Saccharolobus sp. TaxID=2100761 RepID=UPI0031706373
MGVLLQDKAMAVCLVRKDIAGITNAILDIALYLQYNRSYIFRKRALREDSFNAIPEEHRDRIVQRGFDATGRIYKRKLDGMEVPLINVALNFLTFVGGVFYLKEKDYYLINPCFLKISDQTEIQAVEQIKNELQWKDHSFKQNKYIHSLLEHFLSDPEETMIWLRSQLIVDEFFEFFSLEKKVQNKRQVIIVKDAKTGDPVVELGHKTVISLNGETLIRNNKNAKLLQVGGFVF